MNYVSEIRAFYDSLMLNPITTDAQALWHALMYINNKAAKKQGDKWIWPTEFTVSNPTLQSLLQFSKPQLDRMRNVLIQHGRIVYIKGRGNQCGKYRIIPLASHNETQAETQTETQSETQTETQMLPLDNNNSNIYIPPIGGSARTTKERPSANDKLREAWERHRLSPELEQSAKVWVRYKSERGHGYKPTGLSSLLSQIEKHAVAHGDKAVIELIELCMSSNWQGIIWDRLERKDSKPSQTSGNVRTIEKSVRPVAPPGDAEWAAVEKTLKKFGSGDTA